MTVINDRYDADVLSVDEVEADYAAALREPWAGEATEAVLRAVPGLLAQLRAYEAVLGGNAPTGYEPPF